MDEALSPVRAIPSYLLLVVIGGWGAAMPSPARAASPVTQTDARSAQFLAGVAVRGIVPGPELVNNAVHSNMTVRFDEQGSPLKVKALVLTLGQKHFMIVAEDNVVMRQVHCDRIREEIATA